MPKKYGPVEEAFKRTIAAALVTGVAATGANAIAGETPGNEHVPDAEHTTQAPDYGAEVRANINEFLKKSGLTTGEIPNEENKLGPSLHPKGFGGIDKEFSEENKLGSEPSKVPTMEEALKSANTYRDRNEFSFPIKMGPIAPQPPEAEADASAEEGPGPSRPEHGPGATNAPGLQHNKG